MSQTVLRTRSQDVDELAETETVGTQGGKPGSQDKNRSGRVHDCRCFGQCSWFRG